MINKNFKVGLGIVLFLILVALVSFFYTPHNIFSINSDKHFEAPSKEHLFGTDELGRDILSRVMVGTRVVFLVGFVSVFIGLVGGVLLGSLAGYFGGKVDTFIMHIMDALMSFPGILFALMIVSVFGEGITNTMIALGILLIPSFGRITRSSMIRVKHETYIDMAKSLGVPPLRVIIHHMLPNIVSPLIVAASIGFATAILSEASLSYLGLGVMPPFPSWGRMLRDAQQSMLNAPFYAIAPGVMITLAVLGFNLLGDGIDQYLRDRRNE